MSNGQLSKTTQLQMNPLMIGDHIIDRPEVSLNVYCHLFLHQLVRRVWKPRKMSCSRWWNRLKSIEWSTKKVTNKRSSVMNGINCWSKLRASTANRSIYMSCYKMWPKWNRFGNRFIINFKAQSFKFDTFAIENCRHISTWSMAKTWLQWAFLSLIILLSRAVRRLLNVDDGLIVQWMFACSQR